MSDDTQAVNEAQESVTEAPAVEQSTESSVQDTQVTADTSSSQQTQETERKPSRFQSRISELTGEIKQLKSQLEERGYQSPSVAQIPDWLQQPQNPFDGQTEIDPSQLDNYVTQKAESIADLKIQKILADRDQQDNYRRTVTKWADDVESTQKSLEADFSDDPELAEQVSTTLATQLKRLNYDAQGNLRPQVTASELYESIKSTVQVARTKASAKAKESLTDLSDNGALRPHISDSADPEISTLRSNLWNNSKKIVDMGVKRYGVARD